MIQGYLATERLKQVVAVHTNHPLATAKRDKPILGETAVAHEKTASPGRLLFKLAVEIVQIGNPCRGSLPLCFHEIDFALQNKNYHQFARL